MMPKRKNKRQESGGVGSALDVHHLGEDLPMARSERVEEGVNYEGRNAYRSVNGKNEKNESWREKRGP